MITQLKKEITKIEKELGFAERLQMKNLDDKAIIKYALKNEHIRNKLTAEPLVEIESYVIKMERLERLAKHPFFK